MLQVHIHYHAYTIFFKETFIIVLTQVPLKKMKIDIISHNLTCLG